MPMRRLGNVGPTSIGYAFRPGLRTRLTPGGRTWPGKPWDSGGGDFNPPFRYSCPHNRSRRVHGRFPFRFKPGATLPYQSLDSAAPADGLTPDHFRRGIARPVSCYALFKWWLPLSQHPTCLRGLTALVTQRNFGALFGGPGLFPFRRRSLAPAVSLPGIHSAWSSEFDGLRHPGGDPRSVSALHPGDVSPDAAPKGISERTSYHPA